MIYLKLGLISNVFKIWLMMEKKEVSDGGLYSCHKKINNMNHDTAKETQVGPYLNGYPLVCWSNRQQVLQSWLSASREEIQTSDLQISAATPSAEAKCPVHRKFARTPRSSSQMSGYSGSQNPSKEMLTGVQFTGWTSYDCTADENKIELLLLLSKSFFNFLLLLRALWRCGVQFTAVGAADLIPEVLCRQMTPSPAQRSPAQLALFFLYVWDARQSKAHPVLSIEALPQTWTCIPLTKNGTWISPCISYSPSYLMSPKPFLD